jgi:hypothetical protein
MMNSFALLLSAATIAAAPAPVVPAPVSVAGPVKQDVQCFMLYAIAVQRAVAGNDDKVRQAAGLGVMYFFTKLKTEAPTLDLFSTIHQEAAKMQAGPQLKALGEACDTEFQKQGADLRNLGGRLKQGAPQSSSSS